MMGETVQKTRPPEMNTPVLATLQARTFVTSTPNSRAPIEFTSRATPHSRASASAAGKQVPVMTPHAMGSFTNSPSVSSSSSMWTPSSSSSASTVQFTYFFAGSSGTPSSSSGMLPSSSSASAATGGQCLPSIPVTHPRKWFVVLYGRRMGIFHNW